MNQKAFILISLILPVLFQPAESGIINTYSYRSPHEIYNNYFHTFIPEEKLEEDMFQRLKEYYRNLKQCTPGSYQYVLKSFIGHIFILSDSKIRGFQDGKCMVESTYNMPSTYNDIKPIFIQCAYKSQDLEMFNEEQASKPFLWPITQFTFDPISKIPKKMQEIQKQCKYQDKDLASYSKPPS